MCVGVPETLAAPGWREEKLAPSTWQAGPLVQSLPGGEGINKNTEALRKHTCAHRDHPENKSFFSHGEGRASVCVKESG